MTTDLMKIEKHEKLQQLLLNGDLSKLDPMQRNQYYNMVCDSLNLNPLTKPFDYMKFQGKEILYANKNCAEQLRSRDKISIQIVSREMIDDLYVVTARAMNAEGRQDESLAAVPVTNLKGMDKANAMMKCDTKAKRRVTLSICGLGMLDENEVKDNPHLFEPIVPKELEPAKESKQDDSNLLPKPTLKSLMTKYITLYKVDKLAESNALMHIYNRAKDMDITSAEEYINHQIEKIVNDKRSEKETT